MPRATSLQIYLKPGLEDDDRLLALWQALKVAGRPQDTFRRMLQRGMEVLIEEGEFSQRILDYIEAHAELDLDPPGRTAPKPTLRPRARKVREFSEDAGSDALHDPRSTEDKPDLRPESRSRRNTTPPEAVGTNAGTDGQETSEIAIDERTISSMAEDLPAEPGYSPSQEAELPHPSKESGHEAEKEDEGEAGAAGKNKYAFIGNLM